MHGEHIGGIEALKQLHHTGELYQIIHNKKRKTVQSAQSPTTNLDSGTEIVIEKSASEKVSN